MTTTGGSRPDPESRGSGPTPDFRGPGPGPPPKPPKTKPPSPKRNFFRGKGQKVVKMGVKSTPTKSIYKFTKTPFSRAPSSSRNCATRQSAPVSATCPFLWMVQELMILSVYF